MQPNTQNTIRETSGAYATPPPEGEDLSAAPEGLSAALTKYHEDADLESLKRAYQAYLARRERIANPESDFLSTLADGFTSLADDFASLVGAPADSLERSTAKMKQKSDLNEMRSEWEVAGEYLSLGIIEHILETEANNG